MKFVFAILAAFALAVAFSCLETWAVMMLWNHVLCAVFTSLPHLTFWLAFGILCLINIVANIFKKAKKS